MDNNTTDNEIELLEYLKNILGCTYISDLKIEPYNTKAKSLLELLRSNNLNEQIKYALAYINS